jgi:hypothetical protein
MVIVPGLRIIEYTEGDLSHRERLWLLSVFGKVVKSGTEYSYWRFSERRGSFF